MTTSHPSAASRRAVARPRPRVEPVISARLPVSGRFMIGRRMVGISVIFRVLALGSCSVRFGSTSMFDDRGDHAMKLRVAASAGTCVCLCAAAGWRPPVIGQSPAVLGAAHAVGRARHSGCSRRTMSSAFRSSGRRRSGTRETVTDAEFADRQAQAARQAVDRRRGVRCAASSPQVVARGGAGILRAAVAWPAAHWLERGKPSRRTSIVIDPPDGRIPFLNDEARKRAAIAVNARTSGKVRTTAHRRWTSTTAASRAACRTSSSRRSTTTRRRSCRGRATWRFATR